MTNVFDLIEEFYTQDEEWNSVLQQACAEDFLRYKTWQGAKDGELVKIWDYITVLCIYLGNSENFLGDMSREDFIDCVGWCCRNVSGFPATESNIAHFLDVMQEFYAYMKKKRIITRDNAPAEAKAKLLVDGKLQIVGVDGSCVVAIGADVDGLHPDVSEPIRNDAGELSAPAPRRHLRIGAPEKYRLAVLGDVLDDVGGDGLHTYRVHAPHMLGAPVPTFPAVWLARLLQKAADQAQQVSLAAVGRVNALRLAVTVGLCKCA